MKSPEGAQLTGDFIFFYKVAAFPISRCNGLQFPSLPAILATAICLGHGSTHIL